MNFDGKINPFSSATKPMSFNPGVYVPDAAKSMGAVEGSSKGSFKDVMVNLVKDTDKSLTIPDELMNRALTTGDVDIHEVMIANTKADMAVNIASQVVTKVIQAYERVQQIQV